MGSTRPMWVGLDLCDGLNFFWPIMVGWVEFFLTHHDGLGQKIPLTRPMHTPNTNLIRPIHTPSANLIQPMQIY